MDKRDFPKLGIQTSLLGFGCMRFKTDNDGKIIEQPAMDMIDKAIKNGVNYFDTAYVYTNKTNEDFVGRALSRYPRDSFYIATKLPVGYLKSYEDAERIFDEQLKALKTDYIDFYLLHALNGNNWNKVLDLNIIDLCLKLKAEGKIRYLGFSFHDKLPVFKKILDYRDWDFCQIQYNYMDVKAQAGDAGYNYAKKKGVPIVVMEPVRGGLLASLPEETVAPFKAIRPADSQAKWALRWVANHDNVKVILSGMNEMQQLDENLEVLSDFKPMCSRQKHAVKLVREGIFARVNVTCTDCRYCLPCPKGVRIPSIFKVWNECAMYNDKKHTAFSWRNYSDEEKPSSCVKCGACVKKCPQGLAIPELLSQAQAEIDKFLE